VALLAGTTAGLIALRGQLDKAHAAFVYLLVVLGASASRGRRVGLGIAVLAFLCFNFFLLPPYYTFVIADPLDWLVLAAFLVTGAVAAHLLDRARREAEQARRRAEEIERLSTLGAETLNVALVEDALGAIARVVQTTLGIDRCEIYAHDPVGTGIRLVARAGAPTETDSAADKTLALLPYVAEHGVVAVRQADGTTRVGTLTDQPLAEAILAQPEAVDLVHPLRMRGVGRGLLRLTRHGGLDLDNAQRRFADALAYYAALGLERMRLTAEAAHAEALREADRLKDAVLASVSHDLRTPLTTIKALAHEIWESGDARALIVEEEADRLGRFVSDLLDLSRLNSGAMPTAPAVNAAEDLVGAAAQRAAGALASHELRIRLPPMTELLVGRFDLGHAVRILVNVIENAAKYSPPGAPIDLTVEQESGALVFRVADQGPGVPENVRARIFEPFFRLAEAPDAGGSGLGLAIARRLAEAQGGTLAHQPRPGGGSIFELRLPAADLPHDNVFAGS
jgi:two-component system sensor histidine kinase KdpD